MKLGTHTVHIAWKVEKNMEEIWVKVQCKKVKVLPLLNVLVQHWFAVDLIPDVESQLIFIKGQRNENVSDQVILFN